MLLINKTLWRLAKGLWGWIIAIALLKVAALAGTAAFAKVVSGFLGSLFSPESVTASDTKTAILFALLASLLMLCAELLTGEAEFRCTAKARIRLRTHVFSKILELDVGKVEKLGPVSGTNRAVNRAAHGLTIHRQTVTSAPAFFVYLARIAVIAAAAYLAAKGETHPVGTVLLSFVAAASFSSTQSLTTVVSSLLETYAAAERLFLLEDTVPEVQEAEAPVSCGKIESIRFEDVDFYYTDPARMILKGFNLSLKDSEKLGIVGESGIGKSTVLRLLLRFWNTRGGRILINGIPIEQISLEELRRRIAVLEQDTFLFDGSIAENIAFGKPEAGRDEIVAAAKRAGLHNFISTLPEGYETQMGKMSARLSGGEKQRVGIARTLLTDPDVIVMDEPTSSLDVLHEKELLRTLEREYRDKMLIIVSHRHSTLTGCGRIVRLEGGKASDII